MKIFESGKENEKNILLLPGTCCTVDVNFSKVIPYLEKEFHVIGVDYDGFDGMGGTFTTMLNMTEKIEDYIIKNYAGRMDVAYGSSLGGSFVGLLVQRRKIHITHAILGSSDLDQSGVLSAKLKTGLMGGAFYKILKSGELPKWMIKLTEKKMGQEAAGKYLGMIKDISGGMASVSKKSMCNEFYSDLVTPLEEKIDVPGTTVHIFYALKMGEEYRSRYKKHFRNPDIIEQDYGHEELLFFYPEKWVEELWQCVERKGV